MKKSLVNSDCELLSLQAEIGRALWLLMLYWHLQGDVSAWGPVADAATIRDSDVAAQLGVSVFTAARWREKLRDAGVVQLVRHPGGFRVYAYRPRFATCVPRERPRSATGAESNSNRTAWPEIQTTFVQ